MKTTINSLTSKLGRPSQIKIFTMVAALIVPAVTACGQSFWTGGTGDFNNPASWTGAYNSGNPNCCNDSGSNNVVLIQPGDPVWQHGDTLAGQGSGASGSYLQTGSTNNSGYPNNGNWLRLGIGPGGTVGYYTLSNGVVNVAGQTHLGENGTGTLEVDGGTYNTGYNGNPGICAGDGDFGPSTGTLILTGGTIHNINNETWFGEAKSACTGYLIMSGGTFNVNNWFVFGRNGGIGIGTMTGGTINFTGGGQFLIGGGGSGTLNQSGGVINVQNQYLVPQGGVSGLNVLSGNAVVNAHDWVAIGRNGGTGELDISGSASITRDNNNDGGANFDVGAGGSGTVNQNGGAVTNLAGQTWIGETSTATWNLNSGIASLGTIVICKQGSATGTLNLNGGLCQAAGINSTSVGFSTINFNGGTLQAIGNNASFMSGLTQALVSSGGAIFDSQAFSITVPESLADNGGGSLTKNGAGTLTLAGANSYAGATMVNAGTLATTTASSGGGSYTAASGTTLSVQVASANGQLSASSLTFAGPSAILDVDLNTFGVPSSAPLNVGGVLTANGTVTINILSAAPLAAGPVPLVQYGSPAGSGSFVLGSFPPGESGYLTNSAGLIALVITSAGAPRWNGNVTGGAWDINLTTNWIDLITTQPTTYHDGEPVLFDDNATGTTTVNLATTVSPGSVTVNDTQLPYTLQGSGKINGTTGLLKEGTNTLSILNTGGNGYTGPTVIDGGILAVTSLANGGSPSAIGASSASPTNLVLAGGTLSYSGPAVSINRGYADDDTNSAIDIFTAANLTLSGSVIAAPGSGFIKAGPAQLAYATVGSNTLSDSLGYTVAQGTVLFNGSGTGQTNNIAGNFYVGDAGSTNATVVLSNNTTLNVLGGTTEVGNGGGSASSGVINQAGGIFNAGTGQIWIGQGANGVGTFNLSNGTFNVANWLAVGRAAATGTLNLSGSGVLYDAGGGGGNLDIGTSGGIGGVAGTGTLNQTGGTLTNTASQTWLGEGTSGQAAAGTWNMSGGTAQLGEVHVGVGGTGTSTVNISGTGAITCAGYVDISLASGTSGNVNIGSISQPGGSLTADGDLTVGDLGTGVLNLVTNGGGLLTVHGTIYLSRGSATAFGSVNLNSGGAIVAGFVNNGWGFGNNLTNNPQSFNFNGGTLKAYVGSPYFIQPYVNAIVQSGGAIIDDGGFNITVLAALVNGGGGGGLTKLGSGTLYLNGDNTYTGTTLVSAGALGGTGTIAGPVSVASGATLVGDEGSIQTFYINNTLTLASGSTTSMKLTPASNDQIAGLSGVTYGGALVVTNTSGSPLTAGSVYKLFNSSSPGSGNFSSITVLPIGGATFNPATGELTITSAGAPVVNPPTVSGGDLIVSGSGGTPGGGYTLLSSTNVATPLADWTTNTTGVFSGSGTFTNAIPITNSVSALFFELRVP